METPSVDYEVKVLETKPSDADLDADGVTSRLLKSVDDYQQVLKSYKNF